MRQNDPAQTLPSRVLLTGDTGFVGAALVRRLLADGAPMRALRRTRRATAPSENALFEAQVVGDLETATLSPDLFEGVDVVVHLAARVHQMKEDPEAAEARHHEANAVVTERLARAAAQAGVRRFVYLSSIKVNGERTDGRPFSTADEPVPLDAYGRSKWAAEQALARVSAETRLSVAILRPCLVVGPGAKGNLLALCKILRAGVPLPLGRIHNRRSMVGLDNLVELIIAAMRAPFAGVRTGLAADDEPVSTPELVSALAEGLGVSARLLPVPVGMLRLLGRVLGRQDQVGRLVEDLEVDNRSAKEGFGWVPAKTTMAQLSETSRAISQIADDGRN